MASPYNFRQKKSINYNENGKQSNPSSARKSRERTSEASSNSNGLRYNKSVTKNHEDEENDSPESSQPPILVQPEIILLDSTESSSPIVIEDMSPPILTREVNNNWEEKDENSRGWSPPPELEKMKQMPFESPFPIANGSRLCPIFEALPVVTLNELMDQRASLPSNHSKNPSNSRKCPICEKQSTGFHYGIRTCQYCSIFFQQKVSNIPNYACYCRRVWKHSFNFKRSCHCCRFQRCLDLGMQVPPDSMYSRISPSLENPGLCQICGDIGTSHCRGVVTCSACTFFFFRSTQKPFEGVCFKNCPITLLTRGNCPSCRYKKLGQVEKTLSVIDLEEPEGPVEQDGNTVSVVEQLSQLFDKTCPYTEAKVKMIIPREFGWKPNPTSQTNRISAWIYFSSLLNNEVESIINFIQSIRKTLTLNDLITMIPRHAFSLLLLWWTRTLSTKGLLLSNGEFVDMETLKLLYGEKLTDKMVVFAEDLKNASDKELAVIMRLVLLQPMDGDSKSFKLRIKEEYFSLRRCLLEECAVNVIELIKLIERVNGIEKMYQEEIAPFLKNNEESFQTGNLFHSVFITKWPDFVSVGDSNGEDDNVEVHG